MSALKPKVMGWCPGALRPMESGDGLMVRLRITGGIVPTALGRQIATWSHRWGNGQIDLSNRANLHMRGLSQRYLPLLQAALAEWGLLDDTEATEAVRNVVCSPLAGLDPSAELDIRPITAALEQHLTHDVSLHALPGKFGFAIDDGGLLPLDDRASDIRFVARRTQAGPVFDIHLAGAPNGPLGRCTPDALLDIATALGRAFLHLRAGREIEIRRMRHLVAARGAEAIGHHVGLAPVRAVPPVRPPDYLEVHPLGVHPLGAGAFIGVGLPFGRIAAQEFAALTSAAAAHGAAELRLTPWRTVLVPLPSLSRARALAGGLTGISCILDPADPRRRIAACPGAPSCARGTTPLRDDVPRLATGMAPGSGIAIHVSGCEKGCAHPSPAPVTLIGRNGRYDLVRNGLASDLPALRNLTLDQAAAHVRHMLQPRGAA